MPKRKMITESLFCTVYFIMTRSTPLPTPCFLLCSRCIMLNVSLVPSYRQSFVLTCTSTNRLGPLPGSPGWANISKQVELSPCCSSRLSKSSLSWRRQTSCHHAIIIASPSHQAAQRRCRQKLLLLLHFSCCNFFFCPSSKYNIFFSYNSSVEFVLRFPDNEVIGSLRTEELLVAAENSFSFEFLFPFRHD